MSSAYLQDNGGQAGSVPKHGQADSGYAHTYSPGPTPGQEIPGAFPQSVEPTPVNEKPFEAPKSETPRQAEYFPPKTDDSLDTSSDTHTDATSTETPNRFAASNQLRPDMPADDASTASIKSGIIGREPKTRFVDVDIPSASLGDAVQAVQPKTPDTGFVNDTATYTVRSFPLKSHADEEPAQSDSIPSSFDGKSMAAHEQRAHESTHGNPSTSPKEPHKDHHYGRNAALAGAGAAGAAGAYSALHDNKEDSGPASHTVGPHKSDAANVLDPTVLPQPEKQKSNVVKHPETGPATHTVGPHDNNLANIVDPRVLPQPEKQMGGNVKHPETGPATKTIGPHKSNVANIADPRVLPEPEQMKNHGWREQDSGPAPHTVGPHQSDIANIVDPRVLPDPAKQKEHKTSGPHQSDMLNRMDPRVEANKTPAQNHNYGRDGALAGAGAAAALRQNNRSEPQDGSHRGAHETTHKPIQTGYDQQRAEPTPATQIGRPVDPQTLLQSENRHHHGRDGAVAGSTAATGLAGHDTQKPYSAYGDQAKSAQAAQPQQDGRSHTARNVAVGAGATSAAAAAYQFHKGEAEKAEAEMHEKDLKSHDKKAKHAHKEHDKEPKKDHEKKGGLLGFLHHKDKDRATDGKEEKHRHHGKDAAVGAGATQAGVAAHDYGKHDHHQKKEPPSPTTSTGSGSKESPSRRRGSVLGIFHRKDKSRRSSEEAVQEEPKIDENPHNDTTGNMASSIGSLRGGRNRLYKSPPMNFGKELQQQAGNQYGEQRYSGENSHSGTEGAYERDARDSMNREYGTSDLTEPHKTAEGYTGNDANPAGTGYYGGIGQNAGFEQARRTNITY